MKKQIWLFIMILCTASVIFAQDPGWPRKFTSNGSVLVVYPPQVENWQDYKNLNFRMAFTLQAANQAKQVVGVVYVNAATDVDTYNHMVALSLIHISEPTRRTPISY